MGLSSSKTKTTTNSSQNNNQTETGTTTPVAPDWLTQAAQDYVGRIGAFGDMDPNSFVAPGSPLQNMAWNNASSLGDWRGQAATASQLALGAGHGGPNYAGSGGAMGRYGMGLSPVDARFGGGSQQSGAAQMPASALGGPVSSPALGAEAVQTKAMTGGQMQRPEGAPPGAEAAAQQQATTRQQQAEAASLAGAPRNAFSGASSRQFGGGPAYTYQAPNVQGIAPPTAHGAAQTNIGSAPQASASGYSAPQLQTPGLVSGQSYSAPQLGPAGGYAAARTGAPIGAETRSYNPTGVTPAGVAPTQDAFAYNADAQSLLPGLTSYMNPYQGQVVNATLADFDAHTAQQQAAMQGRAAAAGALGGSRFGIAEGQFQGDQARSRALLEAQLLGQGFDAAAGLSQYDTGLRQQAGLFNAQNQTGVSGANAAAANSRAAQQAGFVQQAGLANQQSQDAAGALGANAWNTSELQSADAAGRAALDYAGRADTASQFGLTSQQQRDLANAGYTDTAARYGADSGMQAALANQNMLGQFSLAQGGLDAAAGQYNASNAQQIALANQGLAGQYGLAQFGADTGAAAQYAGARNQMDLAGYQGALGNAQLQAQLAAQAGQYNAGANNNMSQFNAGQGDVALNRQLQAAGMLGSLANDYGSGTRADLATMAQLGDQQRAIEQAYAMAGPAQLQLMGQLSGMTPYDILVGRQVNGNTIGTTTGTSTQTQTQSPSLFNQLLAAGDFAAKFIPFPGA